MSVIVSIVIRVSIAVEVRVDHAELKGFGVFALGFRVPKWPRAPSLEGQLFAR